MNAVGYVVFGLLGLIAFSVVANMLGWLPRFVYVALAAAVVLLVVIVTAGVAQQ